MKLGGNSAGRRGGGIGAEKKIRMSGLDENTCIHNQTIKKIKYYKNNAISIL